MPFRRGTTLPIAPSLGYSERSDLGPTAGNGFFTRWPDDLALLSEAGITDLRVTFDWSRFQPKPGEFASDWVERYEHFVSAARAIDISVWASLYDAGVPKWFANEGGIDDNEALGRWWPRWVERVADRFGDEIDGWVPFGINPTGLPDSVWNDTWSVLGGGPAPVAISVADSDLDSVESLPLDTTDIVGVALTADVERWDSSLGRAIELATSKPVIVSECSPDDDAAVRRLVDLLDPVEQCELCFVSPAIGADELPSALFDSDRAPLPGLAAFTQEG